MVTSSRLLVKQWIFSVNGSIYSQWYHLQGSLPSVVTVMSVYFLAYLSCLDSSSFTYHIQLYCHTVVQVVHLYNHMSVQVTSIHSYIHITIHSYINTFTYSYTSYTQHQFIHGCISHPKSCFGRIPSVRSSLIIVSSGRFYKRTACSYLIFIKSVIPSVSGQEMSPIKWLVLNNGQLEFTFIMFRVASPKQRTTWV